MEETCGDAGVGAGAGAGDGAGEGETPNRGGPPGKRAALRASGRCVSRYLTIEVTVVSYWVASIRVWR